MSHIVLADGSDFDLTPAFSEPPTLATIAHSLSLLNRFSGHTIRAYSVAEHSLVCAQIARMAFPSIRPELYAAVLFHDAAECITGDVPSPIKPLLGDEWEFFNHRVEQHVWKGIHPRLPEYMQHYQNEVRTIDLTALWLERRDLLVQVPGKSKSWSSLDTGFEPLIKSLYIDSTQDERPAVHYTRFLSAMKAVRWL